VTVFYPDYSSFQGQANPAGAPAIVAKATEGNYYRDADYQWYKDAADKLHVPFSGYHFLKAEISPAVQAKYYFDFAGTVPCMLDVETEGTSKPTVDEVVSFMVALHGLGGRVWGVYFPRCYWGQVGGDLGRLTAGGAVVVASEYRSFDENNWPAPYGGVTPPIWQYTSSYNLNGTLVDYNAFKGTAAQLAQLINGDDMDPNTPLTFDPRIAGWYPDIAKDGGVWTGQQSLNDVLTWMAGRVGHIIHQVENLQKTVNALQTGSGASPQAVADATLADLKAKL